MSLKINLPQNKHSFDKLGAKSAKNSLRLGNRNTKYWYAVSHLIQNYLINIDFHFQFFC